MTSPEASRRRQRLAHMRTIGSLGGLARAAAYDSHAIMANARAAFASSFERQIRERFPELTDEVEIARRAAALRKLHYARMGLKSAQARRRKAARASDSRSDAANGPE
jgi:hypothetical protein